MYQVKLVSCTNSDIYVGYFCYLLIDSVNSGYCCSYFFWYSMFTMILYSYDALIFDVGIYFDTGVF